METLRLTKPYLRSVHFRQVCYLIVSRWYGPWAAWPCLPVGNLVAMVEETINEMFFGRNMRNIWESIVSQMPRVVSIKDVTLCNFLPSSVEENHFFYFYPENFTIWTSNRIILSFCAAVHPGFWTNLISENQMRQSGRVTIILVHAQIQHLWHLRFITSTLISYDPVTSRGVNWYHPVAPVLQWQGFLQVLQLHHHVSAWSPAAAPNAGSALRWAADSVISSLSDDNSWIFNLISVILGSPDALLPSHHSSTPGSIYGGSFSDI